MYYLNKKGIAKFLILKNFPNYILKEMASKQVITVSADSLNEEKTAKRDESGRIARGELLNLNVFLQDGRWNVAPLELPAEQITENSRLELKSCGINSLEQDVAAMANNLGGTITWGLADNGNVVGIDSLISQYKGEDAFVCMLRNKLRQHLNTLLFLSVNFNFKTREGKRLLEITVPKSNKIVLVRGSELYVRSGATTQHLEGDRMIDFICNKNFNRN